MNENYTKQAGWKSKLNNLLVRFRFPSKITFVIIGVASLIWLLIRVVPKPQRATYPCVKATAPWASAFVIYILGITASAFSFKRFGKYITSSRYAMAIVFVLIGLTITFVTIPFSQIAIEAAPLNKMAFAPNEPIGVAKGIMPGRVVWVHDTNATDKTCTNTNGDYWFQNTDQEVVDGMLYGAIKSIANKTDIYEAWGTLFKYFNNNHGKGEVGYTKGEKIYIKINLTTSCCPNWSNQTEKISWLDHMDATPELCLALLRHLVYFVGAEQSDIYLGDPFRRFHDLYWDLLHGEFPNVHYMDGDGFNGREQTTLSLDSLLKFSNGTQHSRIPQEYVDAAYFINMPCLKTHDVGGITLAAKNHQGSIIEDKTEPNAQSALFMHPYLPGANQGHGKYRHLVDYMGHEHLGGKTLLYIVDGIWAGRNWEGIVEKWQMAPFNNDFPSSLFVSLDPVAIESVGYDFLLEEYKDKSADIQYPYIDGTDDYLLQAADPANWPSGIDYDPEGDGTVLNSLGTHEHWNNATDKQYSRNLSTGNGIELFKAITDMGFEYTSIKNIDLPGYISIYPQPATEKIIIEFAENSQELKSVQLFDAVGKLMYSQVLSTPQSTYIVNLENSLSGNYILLLRTSQGSMHSTTIAIK
jgi:hypothetical protein